MNNWLNNTKIFSDFIRPFLDIILLAGIFYRIYRHILYNYGQYIVRSLQGPILVLLIAYIFQLKTVLWLYQLVGPFLVIAIALVFQPELRKMLVKIGRRGWSRTEQQASAGRIDTMFAALQTLSTQRRGALVVFTRSLGLRNVVDTGTRLDAEISGALMLTIFGYDTLLHDGALIVHNGKFVAAGCFLPLSKQENLRKSFGTRHRAAIGITEESDAIVVVVSEENGAISIAVEGVLYYDRKMDDIKVFLRSLLKGTSNDREIENISSLSID